MTYKERNRKSGTAAKGRLLYLSVGSVWVIALVVIVGCSTHKKDFGSSETINTRMRNLSSMEFVADMGAGWNLGNALDTENTDETAWGNPRTTQRMIDEIARMGFRTLRVPVTWRFHMGEGPDYKIDAEWLDRVEEVANYALANKMYVIINIHHDDPWIIPTYAEAEGVRMKLAKVWTQIAERFKKYGDYLIFETLNEPRYEGSPEEWNGGTVEGREVVNQYHKVSVDAIRATGGNNATRKLMVSTYAASTRPEALNDYRIPNNDRNVLVSLHSYFPYAFCLDDEDTTWGTEVEKRALDNELDKIYDYFIAKGQAVVMGEWGATNHQNPEGRLSHARYYAAGCKARGICPIWWDNGNKNEFALFDRENTFWFFPEVAEVILKEVTRSNSHK